MLLYVKATLTGDEDVDVLDYHRQHPRFPHQSVRDQSLNEAQWESYRQLGQHCASPLFPKAAVTVARSGARGAATCTHRSP